MKKAARVIACIVTIFNAFLPACVVSLLGSCFVVAMDVEGGQAITFNAVSFSSIIFGFLFCLIASLLYFYLIKSKRILPRWWLTLALVVASVASIPVHAMIFWPKEIVARPHPFVGGLWVEALFLTVLGTALIAVFARPVSERSARSPGFQSPAWIILFSVGQYMAFFMSAIAMSSFLKMHLRLSADLFRIINLSLRQPFYNRFTEGFILENFQGMSGHLIFMGNAFIWGVVVWLICRRKGVQDACAVSQAGGAEHKR